jgi:hypothetical protein
MPPHFCSRARYASRIEKQATSAVPNTNGRNASNVSRLIIVTLQSTQAYAGGDCELLKHYYLASRRTGLGLHADYREGYSLVRVIRAARVIVVLLTWVVVFAIWIKGLSKDADVLALLVTSGGILLSGFGVWIGLGYTQWRLRCALDTTLVQSLAREDLSRLRRAA